MNYPPKSSLLSVLCFLPSFFISRKLPSFFFWHLFPFLNLDVKGRRVPWSVRVCRECHGVLNDVLNDVFCVVSLRQHDAVCQLLQPPLRCRQAQRGRDLLVAHANGCHFFDGKEFLCGQDRPGGENTFQHLCLGPNVAVVHGCDVSCVGVLSVCNVEKSVVL